MHSQTFAGVKKADPDDQGMIGTPAGMSMPDDVAPGSASSEWGGVGEVCGLCTLGREHERAVHQASPHCRPVPKGTLVEPSGREKVCPLSLSQKEQTPSSTATLSPGAGWRHPSSSADPYAFDEDGLAVNVKKVRLQWDSFPNKPPARHII
jgi:hypothetical protein